MPWSEERKATWSKRRKELGLKASEEHKQRNREAQLKRYAKNPPKPLDEETKKKISETLTGRPGRKHTEETKAKIAAAKRGKKRPKHVVDALVASHKGKPLTQKQLDNLAKGREQLKKHGVPEETRRKMSESQKKRWEQRKADAKKQEV